MSPKNIIFDLDGTLIDSAPHILSSYSAALNKCGIEPIIQLEPSIIGPPLGEVSVHAVNQALQRCRMAKPRM